MIWLDALGLPQLRDIFAEHQIDGQMLVCLTVQDLVEMKIVTAMNHATIARGIQFLRSVDFAHQRLVRALDAVDVAALDRCPEDVERWANTCVVQWLKAIDLREFTPNLSKSAARTLNKAAYSLAAIAPICDSTPIIEYKRARFSKQFLK